MEIKALKDYPLPKYAMALAAVAAAGTLTACNREPALSGTAPMSVETEEVQLMGEEPVIDGVIDPEAYVSPTVEEITLSGDAAVCPAPYQPSEEANLVGVGYEEWFRDGFAKAGIQLLPDSSANGFDCVWMSDSDPCIRICFFDGTEDEQREVLRNYLLTEEDQEYAWGFAVTIADTACRDSCRVAVVDTAWLKDKTPDAAEQIAEDMQL